MSHGNGWGTQGRHSFVTAKDGLLDCYSKSSVLFGVDTGACRDMCVREEARRQP